MSIKRSDIKNDIQDMLASTANIKAGSDKQERTINRVLNRMQLFCDWIFTVRKKTFNYIADIQEYNLQNYMSVSDFQGIYALDGVNIRDKRQFNEMMRNVAHSMKDGDDYLTMELKKGLTINIDGLTAIDVNGEWIADDDAVDIVADANEYNEGNGSLKFDVDVSEDVNNRASVYNSTIAARDLTAYKNRSVYTLEIYLPSGATDITSITLKWGSSVTNYWHKTVTKPLNGSSFQAGWNKVYFDWETATKVLSPDIENIDYYSIEFNYAAGFGDQSNFRVSRLVLSERRYVDLEYFSSHTAKTAAGVWETKPSADNSELLCPDAMAPLIAEWCFYELQRFSRKQDKMEIKESRENVEELRDDAKIKYGYSKTKGSQHINISR